VNGGTEGGVSFSGMNAYLFDRGVFSYSACFETYSFNRIKTLIDDDCPVVHASKGKIPNNTWGEQAHAYVIHGYMVGYDGVPFIIVNDTFGSSNVSINAKSYYHPTTYDGILIETEKQIKEEDDHEKKSNYISCSLYSYDSGRHYCLFLCDKTE